MICHNCQSATNRVRVVNGKDHCTNCSSLSVTGGSRIDGSITRNSFRVREQQKQMQGDMTPPYTYDKHKHKVVPSRDFIKLFPEQAEKTFSNEEFKSVGVTKLEAKT